MGGILSLPLLALPSASTVREQMPPLHIVSQFPANQRAFLSSWLPLRRPAVVLQRALPSAVHVGSSKTGRMPFLFFIR